MLVSVTCLMAAFVFSACGSGSGSDTSSDSKDYSSSNSEVKEAKSDDKATAGVIAEKVLSDHYRLSSAAVNVTDDNFKVTQMPDDENAEDGTVYKNVYSVIGSFDNKGANYSFDMTYSLKDDSNFSVIYFYTPYDDSKTINTPLKSEQ